MDSTNCVRSDSLTAIKEKIRSGELTFEEMNRRLEKAIDLELEKPPEEMDVAFIKACTDLLYELNNSTPYESKASQYEEEWKSYRAKQEKVVTIRRRVTAVAGIAASLLVLFIVGDGLLHREWLTGQSTQDEQQYVVEGHEFDPGLVANSSAANDDGEQSLTTDSLEAVNAFMGFSLPQPSWMPDGWELVEYRCLKNEDLSRTTTVFQHSTNEHRIIYEVKVYSDTATVQDEIEQNAKGTTHTVNGYTVYLLENYDMVNAVWFDGTTSYKLFVPAEEDHVLKIISSIE